MTAVLASDTFNRADEASILAPWVTASGLLTVSINTNQIIAAIDNNNRGVLYSGPTWPNDQFSKAKMFANSTGGVRQGPALYVRFAGAANTCYRFSTDHAASTNCNISRFLAGSRTTIQDFTQAWSDGDTWELRVEGPASASLLRTFLNGVQVSSVTDNSSIASGTPGLGVSGSATMVSWSIDDWSGGRAVVEGRYRLYGPAQIGTSAVDVFNVPTGYRVTIKRIWCQNPSGSPVDFTLSVGTDAASTRLYDSYNIPAGGEVSWNRRHALSAGEKIQAYAGTGSTLVLVIDGLVQAV